MLQKLLLVLAKIAEVAPAVAATAATVEGQVTGNEPLVQKVHDASDGLIAALESIAKVL